MVHALEYRKCNWLLCHLRCADPPSCFLVGRSFFPLKIHRTSQMMVFSCMVGVPYKGQLFIAFSNNQNVYLPMDGRQREDRPDLQNQGKFFFHECGRRVGMVPRSSLKEGKKGRWWRMERRPQKTNPKPNTQARRPSPPSCSLPYTLGETCETETSDN